MAKNFKRTADEPYNVMDLKALRCFLEMARHGSLTRAGIELGISEAAVSQRVKALERYLGGKLYEARGGRVRLTPAGERTMTLAMSVFEEVGQFERELRNGSAAIEITLSAHDSVLRYLLPDKVEAFCQSHPLARLRLLARPIEETVRLVRANECDLAVIPSRRLPNDLTFQAIATYPACLVLPKGHALTRRARADFQSLLDVDTVKRYPLVILEAQREAGLLANALERLNLPLMVTLEVGTIDTLKHYVARGLGIAVISELCVTEDDRAHLDIVSVPSQLGGESTYGVVIRRDKRRSPALNSLLRLLGASD